MRIFDIGNFSIDGDLVSDGDLISDVLAINGDLASDGDLANKGDFASDGDLDSGGDIVLMFRLYIPLCTDNHFLTLDDIFREKSGVVETS